MDRVDAKFTFSAEWLPVLLGKLQTQYRVLQVNTLRIRSYNTLYFDTPDLNMYLVHHNGHAHRYKIRYRKYADSGSGFLEIKCRNNKGRMLKERMTHDAVPGSWSRGAFRFISERTPYDPFILQPVLWVNYQRITLIGKASHERVTIDRNLEFVHGAENKAYRDIVIVEVKQPNHSPTPVTQALKEMHIRADRLSKYCLGITQLYPQVKKNNFKEQLLALNKIIYDTPFSTSPGI